MGTLGPYTKYLIKVNRLEYGGVKLVPIAKPLFWWYFNYLFFFKIMLVRSNILMLKIDLSERVSKYWHIASMPPRVGYWGTYTIYIQYSILCIIYTVEKKENTLIILMPGKYIMNRNFIILFLWLFINFSDPLLFRARCATESCQNPEKLKEMPNPPQKKDFKKKRK